MWRRFRSFDRRTFPDLHERATGCARTELLDYPAIARLKLASLRAAYSRFSQRGSPERRAAFDRYRRDRAAELEWFAAFETLRRRHPGPWTEWPEPWSKPDEAALRSLREAEPDEFGFHQFLQWNAEAQLQRCSEVARDRGLSIGLYLDTAIGVDGGGADAWMGRGAFLRGLSIGAPPDPVQSCRTGLGAYRLQSTRPCGRRLRAVPTDAARGHALCRRHPPRSCARADAAVCHPARAWR